MESHDVIARRFRRGGDYTLATGHEGKPRLELGLGITPTTGWGDDVAHDDQTQKHKQKQKSQFNGKGKGKAKATPASESKKTNDDEEVGGVEVYMAGDDDDDDEDAAVYKTADDDDNILFFQAASWNKLTIVLRDSGALKFVKYVSKKAKGDRWDISGVIEIEELDDDEEGNGEGSAGLLLGESDDEIDFDGFSDEDASESDESD